MYVHIHTESRQYNDTTDPQSFAVTGYSYYVMINNNSTNTKCFSWRHNCMIPQKLFTADGSLKTLNYK